MNKIHFIRISSILSILLAIIIPNITKAQNEVSKPKVIKQMPQKGYARVRVKSNTNKLNISIITNRDSLFNNISATNIKDASWSRIIYRKINLNNPDNAVLYYPENPVNGQQNLFCHIFRLLNNNQIKAYEYIDGYEIFNSGHILPFDDLLDKFKINHNKQSNYNNAENYKVENVDIPSNEVKSYYIKEAYYFDLSNSTLARKVIAICPIITEISDYGEELNIPMFWIKFDDIKPYLGSYYVMLSSINNVDNYTLSDYFDLNLYKGDIVKTKNLLNKSINQITTSPDSIKIIQNRIETEIRNFEKAINNEKSTTIVSRDNNKDTLKHNSNSRDKRVIKEINDIPSAVTHINYKSTTRSVRR